MPALAVLLSLDYASCQKMIKAEKIETQLGDVVPFISGLLLGGDVNIRTWFSLFIRNGQKVRLKKKISVIVLTDHLFSLLFPIR